MVQCGFAAVRCRNDASQLVVQMLAARSQTQGYIQRKPWQHNHDSKLDYEICGISDGSTWLV